MTRLQVDNILPDMPNIQFALPLLLPLRFSWSSSPSYGEGKGGLDIFQCQAKQAAHPPSLVLSRGDTAGSNSLHHRDHRHLCHHRHQSHMMVQMVVIWRCKCWFPDNSDLNYIDNGSLATCRYIVLRTFLIIMTMIVMKLITVMIIMMMMMMAMMLTVMKTLMMMMFWFPSHQWWYWCYELWQQIPPFSILTWVSGSSRFIIIIGPSQT